MGADPAVSLPDTSKIVEALKSLDLLIVQDMALTETAELAHVVLPATSWAEKDGTYTNTEGVTQKVCKAVEPTDYSLTDWQIISDLASAMDMDIGQNNKEGILKEINSLLTAPQDSDPPTRAFNPVQYAPGEETDETYPLNMVVRDVLHHAGSMSTRSQFLNLVVPEAILEMSTNDAEKFGITDDCHVRITSRRGTAYLKAAVSADVPDGSVYVPAHFPHSGVRNLTLSVKNGGISIDAVNIEKLHAVTTS
jgi:predicted molibdopterin-dependent oxidoreductase YjgC